MPLTPLNVNARVGDQAFDALRTAIVSGRYEAGKRLQVRDLAEELGISVMPVREAITRLEEAGLVEAKPYRGAVVKDFDLAELLSIYEVRRLLEVDAARKGVTDISPQVLEVVESDYRELSETIKAGQIVEYLDLDERILAGIYTASGNQVLVDTINRLWSQCRRYKILGAEEAYAEGPPERLLGYQRELLDVAATGDADAAARIINDSLDRAIERIREAMT